MLKQRASDKKESQIEQMSSEQIMNELKQKRLPTFGTANERKDRLKKFYGKYPAQSDWSNNRIPFRFRHKQKPDGCFQRP